MLGFKRRIVRCPQCGGPASRDDASCSLCGAMLREALATQDDEPAPPGSVDSVAVQDATYLESERVMDARWAELAAPSGRGESLRTTQAQYKRVGGWLLLLCIQLTVLAPLTTLWQVWRLAQDGLTTLPSLAVASAALRLAISLLGIYAGLSLLTRRARAVEKAQWFLLASLAYNILNIFASLALVSTMPAGYSPDWVDLINAFGPLLASGLAGVAVVVGWLSYLAHSERVADLYG